ncbi:uncharacterized protein [Euphorbia lathyris]|uniref:uncharacterized protein n=1 Tax=Euphorbia lathyris TaxID=212925 RepID=UPI003313BA0D
MAGVYTRAKKNKRLPPMFRGRPPILNDYSEDETLPPSESQDLSNMDAPQVGWRCISRENSLNDETRAKNTLTPTSRPLLADLRNKRIRASILQEPVPNASLHHCSHPSAFDDMTQNLRKSNMFETIDDTGTRQLQKSRSLPPTLNENNQFDDPSQLDIEANHFNSGSSIPARGLYKGANLDKLTNNRKDKLIVFIPPGKSFRPIGQHERKLASWLGYCARSIGRRSESWDQNLAKHRPRLWNMIKDYFDVSPESPNKWKRLEELGKVEQDTPEMKRSKFESYCFSVMRVLFRKWKHELHNKYKQHSSDEERLKHVPRGLSPNDWKDLVTLFGSKDFKAWSSINSDNRKYQKVVASSGPTPFAQVEYDLIDEETGELPDASDVWMATHSILDEEGQNHFRDSESRRLYEEMKRIENEPRNENESDPTPDDVLQQVFGVRSGYVRGKGLGYKASTKGMVCSARKDDVEELKNEVAILTQKLKAQEEREKAQKEREQAVEDRIQSYFKVMEAIAAQNSLGTQNQNLERSSQNGSEE